MPAEKKLITIFGATGVQGGSVVSAILSHPTLSSQFHIRAITRDPSKPSAQKLASQGVEPVKADLEDPSSLRDALQGSHSVFAVTNYWEKMSKSGEIKQGENIADVCLEVGVKHLIWSSLPYVSELTGGALTGVEHFDSKAQVARYIEGVKGKREEGMVSSYFMPGFYMQNIRGMIKPGQDGTPTLIQPWDRHATQVALLDAKEDTGKFVAGILLQAMKDPKSVDGLQIHATSEWITPGQIVDTLTKVSGSQIKFQQVPEEMFKGFLPEAVAEEMTENMVLVRDWSYYGKGQEKEQGRSDRVLEGTGLKKTTWEDFVRANGPWEWKQEGEADLYKHL